MCGGARRFVRFVESVGLHGGCTGSRRLRATRRRTLVHPSCSTSRSSCVGRLRQRRVSGRSKRSGRVIAQRQTREPDKSGATPFGLRDHGRIPNAWRAVSAEHGIEITKRSELAKMMTPTELHLMESLNVACSIWPSHTTSRMASRRDKLVYGEPSRSPSHDGKCHRYPRNMNRPAVRHGELNDECHEKQARCGKPCSEP